MLPFGRVQSRLREARRSQSGVRAWDCMHVHMWVNFVGCLPGPSAIEVRVEDCLSSCCPVVRHLCSASPARARRIVAIGTALRIGRRRWWRGIQSRYARHAGAAGRGSVPWRSVQFACHSSVPCSQQSVHSASKAAGHAGGSGAGGRLPWLVRAPGTACPAPTASNNSAISMRRRGPRGISSDIYAATALLRESTSAARRTESAPTPCPRPMCMAH